MFSLRTLIVAAIFVSSDVFALKFLFYNPLFGKSHVTYVGKLADLLVQAGHEVVSYQPINSLDFTDTGVKLARNIQRQPDFNMSLDINIFGKVVWNQGGKDMFKMTKAFGDLLSFFATSCEHQLKDVKLMEELKAEKFDFAFTEYFDICGVALFERIGVEKYGALISSTLNGLITSGYGIPLTLSFIPEVGISTAPPLTFWDRVQNVIIHTTFTFFFNPKIFGSVQEIARKYVREDFNLETRFQEASVLFVNIDEFLEFPRPITHKIHYCGGIGMSKPEKLSPKFEKTVNASKRGFVFMSFGTVAKSQAMPDSSKKAFLEAFSEFPDITFLWKYEVDDGLAKDYPNVITDSWWPQKELLIHPKLLAFITHGGANSISEAAVAGAPIITIPLFGDQNRNAFVAEFRGFGVQLDVGNLTKEAIVGALKKITGNESYNKKAKELSNIIRAKPHSAEEVFIRYSEFAAKFDLHEKLDLYGRHLSTIQFYNMDALAFIIGVVLIILTIIVLVLKCLVCCLLRRCRSREIKTKSE